MRRFPSLALAGLLIAVCHLASAQEWSRFRGPNGSGESEATTIPAQWTEKDINWKTSLPGVGHSSPVLWGDKIFLLSADTDKDARPAMRYVLCVNAKDGQLIWKKEFQGGRCYVMRSLAHPMLGGVALFPPLLSKKMTVTVSGRGRARRPDR